MNQIINIFYEEPDPDRWVPFDRYPRRIIRRLVRGKPRPGGQTRVFLNLCDGLDRLGVKYRVNDYRYARRNSHELVGIIGKPFVLEKVAWKNPILFGASVFSHPLDDPTLFDRLPVRRMLVPGEWMRQMCEPYFGDRVAAWPVGINTTLWRPTADSLKNCDVLIYDKVRWEHDEFESSLISPIRKQLRRKGLSFSELRYGFYEEEDFHDALKRSRAMIFLCEHETQGIAYQQALSCGVPILAWDRGGFWQDPAYFPHNVRYGPVSSVPYWDERCGVKFSGSEDFSEALDVLWERCKHGNYNPRDYIMENLTLEKSAQSYLDHWKKAFDNDE